MDGSALGLLEVAPVAIAAVIVFRHFRGARRAGAVEEGRGRRTLTPSLSVGGLGREHRGGGPLASLGHRSGSVAPGVAMFPQSATRTWAPARRYADRASSCASSRSATSRRCRGSARRGPSRSVTRGSQPSCARASEMSALRCVDAGRTAGVVADRQRPAAQLGHELRQAVGRDRLVAADVDRLRPGRRHERQQRGHAVVDVAEAAALTSGAPDAHLRRAQPARDADLAADRGGGLLAPSPPDPELP